MRRFSLWVLLALLAWTPSLARAAGATVVTFETKNLNDGRVQTGSMYFAKNRLKIVTVSTTPGSQPDMIYRGDQRLVWIVDHDRKSYIQMDRETMQQMANQFAGVYAELEARLAKLPPEQRAQAERMFKDRLPQATETPPRGELINTGEPQTINGYQCIKYEFYLNGVQDSELWVTRSSELNFSSMAELLESMGEFYSGLTRNLPGGAESADFDFEIFGQLDGFPILIRNLDGDRVTTETLMRQIRTEEVRDDFFDPPEGYTKVSPMQRMKR